MSMTDKQTKFIEEIIDLSKKYGLCLSHEDTQGSFLIEEYDESLIEWIRSADYDIDYR